MSTFQYFIGLDLGQAQDFTALAVLQRPLVPAGRPSALRRPAYDLGHLQRFTLGTPYPEIFATVRKLLQTPPLPGAFVAVDQTGVGSAVVNMLSDYLQGHVDCQFAVATLTTGHDVTRGEESGLLIPKKELVGTLQVLLQTRRLHIASSLPDVP